MSSVAKKVIIAVVVVVLIVIATSVGVAIYGWRAAVRVGDRQAAIQNLKTIGAVEIQYYDTHNRTFGTFDQMVKEQMLSSRFAGNPAIVDGYVFTLTVTPRTATVPSSFAIQADPKARNDHFYLDSMDSDTIHVNADNPAGPNDPKSNF